MAPEARRKFRKGFPRRDENHLPRQAPDVIAVDEASTRMAAFDRQQARFVEMRFFGGLNLEETAAVLEVSRTTVKRNWNLSKAWLAPELRKGDRK
jgi:RNA polymerase sigma-70 factor, ECF subfamily